MSINALQVSELNELEGFKNDRFRVTDLNSANWVLRKLTALKARENEVNTLANAEVERINTWREGELKSVTQDREYFEMLLHEFHAEQLQADPKAKTITTPYGKLKSTTRKPSPKKLDDEVLLKHLKDSGEVDYIKAKESPDWAEFKKTLRVAEVDGEFTVIDENGVKVPGVEADMGGTSFSVEVDA